MQFVQGDLSNGLPDNVKEQPPFDLYFSSYGTFAHFHDDQSTQIIADICRHASSGALFVGDWLGRYTYEWQDLWHHSVEEEYWMDYGISYIYAEEERSQIDIATFPLRLMCQDEIQRIIDNAAAQAGCEIQPVKYFDRSILIGRHMDTHDYNKHSPVMRYPVNSLFEGYTRTDLESLKVDYVPRPGFDSLNQFFEMFFNATNTLVEYTRALLANYQNDDGFIGPLP